MFKVGQIYVSKLTGVERTVIHVQGQNENDYITFKTYCPNYGVIYSAWTIKHANERLTLKEETK